MLLTLPPLWPWVSAISAGVALGLNFTKISPEAKLAPELLTLGEAAEALARQKSRSSKTAIIKDIFGIFTFLSPPPECSTVASCTLGARGLSNLLSVVNLQPEISRVYHQKVLF